MVDKTFLRVAVGVALFLLAVILASVDWQARALHKRLDTLLELVEKDGAENPLMTAAKAKRVEGFFTDAPHIRLSDLERRITEKSEVRTALLALRTRADRVSVHAGDRRLVFGPDRERAELSFDARVRIESEGRVEQGTDRIDTSWVRRAGEWLIDAVEMESERWHPGPAKGPDG